MYHPGHIGRRHDICCFCVWVLDAFLEHWLTQQPLHYPKTFYTESLASYRVVCSFSNIGYSSCFFGNIGLFVIFCVLLFNIG
jgi:hypothetical protein